MAPGEVFASLAVAVVDAHEGHDAPQSAGVGPPARARAQSGEPLFDRAVRGLRLARSRASEGHSAPPPAQSAGVGPPARARAQSGEPALRMVRVSPVAPSVRLPAQARGWG